MKKLCAAFLSIVLSVSMTACSSSSRQDETTTIELTSVGVDSDDTEATEDSTQSAEESTQEVTEEITTEPETEAQTEEETEADTESIWDETSIAWSSNYYESSVVWEYTSIDIDVEDNNINKSDENNTETEKEQATHNLNETIENLDNTINNLNYKGGTVPKVYINTEGKYGQKLEKTMGYVYASIEIDCLDGTVIKEENEAQVKVRGNSTSTGGKKPYAIKFSDKQDIFGMGAAKKWVLLADFFDPSLMRNYIALDMAKTLGLAYTSEKQYVEVWIDGIYVGVYLFTEPVEDGKTRVNLDKSEGDFMIQLEYNRYEAGRTYFTTSLGYRFMVDEPEKPTAEQMKHITKVINEFEKALKQKNWERVKQLIDVESFAKYGLLLDYLMTVDMRISSVYFYYKNGKLYAGPAWDFDLSMGNSSAADLQMNNFSRMHECCWFEQLLGFSEFSKYVKGQFLAHQSYFNNIHAKGGLIDSLLSKYSKAFQSNFSYTGFTPLDTYCAYTAKPAGTFAENVNKLRSWLSGRYRWYLNYMNGIKGAIVPETTEAPTTEVPTTEVPTTEKPTTEAPTTEVPTTEKPTTEAPTTTNPTTENPAAETETTPIHTKEETTAENNNVESTSYLEETTATESMEAAGGEA